MSGTGEVMDMKPTNLHQHVHIALDRPTNIDAMLKSQHDADALADRAPLTTGAASASGSAITDQQKSKTESRGFGLANR